MSKKLNRILVVDGSYLLHRALHLPNVFDLKNSKGVRTGGVFQFLRMLVKEVREITDCFPVVVFDMGLARRRVELDPEYKKATERAMQDAMVLTPEESDIDYVTQYRKQRTLLSIILPSMGIPVIKFAAWEGDDLMYLLSRMAEKSVILTDDRDMLQLLSDKCDVKRPMKEQYYTLASFLEETGYNGVHDFIIQKAIVGDSSDNIKSSVKGVGDGTVGDMVKLIRSCRTKDFPTEEQGLRALCESAGVKYRKAYLNWDKNRFMINLQLVNLYLVKAEPEMYESMLATIENSEAQADYFNAVKLLAKLEIKDFSMDDLIAMVKNRRRYLWL